MSCFVRCFTVVLVSCFVRCFTVVLVSCIVRCFTVVLVFFVRCFEVPSSLVLHYWSLPWFVIYIVVSSVFFVFLIGCIRLLILLSTLRLCVVLKQRLWRSDYETLICKASSNHQSKWLNFYLFFPSFILQYLIVIAPLASEEFPTFAAFWHFDSCDTVVTCF